MEICSSNSIRNMDKDYIEKFNMPSIVLMENAIIKFLENIDLTKERSLCTYIRERKRGVCRL